MPVKNLIATSLLCVLGAGCGAHYYEPLEFSPDGSTVAWLCRDIFLLVPDSAVGSSQKRVVYWYAADTPGRRRSVVLCSGSADSHETQHHMAFSPDSRRLAVWTNRRLVIVDLATGSDREVVHLSDPPEEVAMVRLDSMAWMSPSQIAYATWTEWKQQGEGEGEEAEQQDFEPAPVLLVVRRLRLDPPGGEPKAIFETRFRSAEVLFRSEVGPPSWSPDGRWLLLVDKAGGGLMLLELATGARHVLDAGAVELAAVAWRPDSTAVLCIVSRKDQKEYATLLVDAADRKVTDLTGDFARAGVSIYSPELHWTGDGTHVFADIGPDVDNPYPIVRLSPFAVLPLGQRVKQAVGFFHPGYEPIPLPIRMCPVPGRVIVHAADGSHYLSDYEGRKLERIPGSVISPDGKRVAGFDKRWHTLHVAPLAAPPE